MKNHHYLLLSLTFCAAPFSYSAGNATHGQELYQARCFACHSVDANRVGPLHRGVFNRRAGSVADYSYSSALKKSGLTWNEKNLDRWLANPEQTVPGQKMGYSVNEAADRADLIAYLKTLK